MKKLTKNQIELSKCRSVSIVLLRKIFAEINILALDRFYYSIQNKFIMKKVIRTLLLLIAPILITAHANAKILTDYGKVYIVASAGPTNSTQTEQNIFRTYEEIEIAMGNTTNTEVYTILFFAEEYHVSKPYQYIPINTIPGIPAPGGVITWSYVDFDFTHYNLNFPNNKTVNIIGLQRTEIEFYSDLAIPNFTQGTLGTQVFAGNTLNNYINTQYARTNITSNGNPDDPSFLSSSPSVNYPTIISDIDVHEDIFAVHNCSNGTAGVYQNNTINLFGLHFTSRDLSEAHIFPNKDNNNNIFFSSSQTSTTKLYYALQVYNMKNVYIDNVRISNMWGCGIIVQTGGTFANHIEVCNNIILNTWGYKKYLPFKAPSTVGIELSGGANGYVQKNIVKNDISVTKQIALGVGICAMCEDNKNLLIEENYVSGYDFSFWCEGNAGGMRLIRNRSDATERGLVISKNVIPSLVTNGGSYLVPQIEDNYFTNIGMPTTPNVPPFLCSEYPFLYHGHISFPDYSIANNFITFKNNTVDIDESLYIQKYNPASFGGILSSSPAADYRLIFENQQQNYVEANCNTFKLSGNTTTTTNFYYDPTIIQHGWLKGNTFENFNGSSNDAIHLSCNVTQANNTFTNVLPPPVPSCTTNTTILGCDREYPNTVTSGPLTIDYELLEGCDMMSGTFCFRVNGGVPAYTFYLDGIQMGIGSFNNGAITAIVPGNHTFMVQDANSPSANTWSYSFTITLSPNWSFTNSNCTLEQLVVLVLPTDINQSQNIVIDGTFTINANTEFKDCNFSFKPNAKIVVAAGMTLVLDHCTLEAGCNDYWQGIIAENATSEIIINNSTIQDMIDGVQAKNNANLIATGNTFKNNLMQSILFENISNASYAGVVTNNTFLKDANYLSYANQLQVPDWTGVTIKNSNSVNIGDALLPALGNTFTNLLTGVHVKGDASIGSILLSNTNLISICNNIFNSITDNTSGTTYVQIMNNVYNSAKGTAVFIDYGGASNFDAHTIVSNTSLPSTESMLNCTKGIISINNNLVAKENYIRNADYGIMNYNLFSKTCNVDHNTIYNAHIGTQMAGNYDGYTLIQNTITIDQGIEVSNAGFGLQAFMYPGVGIDIKQNNPTYVATQSFLVDGNTITIPCFAGKGIANLGTNRSELIKNNNIYFTVGYGIGVPSIPYHDPSLYGIFTSNCKELTLNSNLIDGQYSNSFYQNTFSKAYYFETSQGMVVYCNKARATKQGLYAWGKNFTASGNIASNKFKYNLNPLYTLDNGSPQGATFGDIGDGSADNGNDWLYNMGTNTSWLQNSQFKIWRFSNVPITDKIITSTNLLTSLQSGSTNSGKEYQVSNPTGLAYSEPCADLVFGNSGPPIVAPEPVFGDVDNAEDVALQNESYIDFLQVGEWLNNHWLYDKLSDNEDLRNGSSILSNFYNTYRNTTIGNIEKADLAMNVLFDFNGNDSDMIALYNNAIDRNNEIVNAEEWEMNEAIMNTIALHLARFGKDSITETQKLELEVLANTCPFVGGSAVYKARNLFAFYNPIAQYNDRLLCIQSSGQNKNSMTSNYINLDSLYEAQTNAEANILRQQINTNKEEVRQNVIATRASNFEEILLYPNPASEFITISYPNKEGKLILYDAVGKIILVSLLSKENDTKKIVLPPLSNGIYNYKIVMDSEVYLGKLNIMQYE